MGHQASTWLLHTAQPGDTKEGVPDDEKMEELHASSNEEGVEEEEGVETLEAQDASESPLLWPDEARIFMRPEYPQRLCQENDEMQ
ncbi:hypothetical protein scyTo_0000126 [Scyliorhinus torazame]|uniref:Uncharacterized protein n=1 Tax=Scyliorhinus torazame TaxID=75743 RepID=A0A401NQN5_SCYTO|nr:hypothetical protein [Scyliorhinus torazame]